MTKVLFENLVAQGDEDFYNIQQEILLHTTDIITDLLGSDSPYAPPVEVSNSEVEFGNSQS